MNKLKLIVTISEAKYIEKLKSIYDEYNIIFKLSIRGVGTASSSLLNYLGLAETSKIIDIAVVPDYLEYNIINKINDSLNIKHPGTGIVFSTSLSSANKFLLDVYEEKVLEEKIMNDKKYHLIITIVLEGHLEQVMSAAKRAGAHGGTAIRGRGLGNKEAAKIFGFEIEPGRELVLNVVDSNIKNKVVEEITKETGIKTPCKGICLSLPLDNAIGIDNQNYAKQE